jgi:hydroxyacylglutathione hydrolase
MVLETIKTEGLALLSYVVGDDDAGICAVIDPRRDAQVYVDVARENNVRITHILETHIHADFVSGSRELSELTGAKIYGGKSSDYGFDVKQLEDGDELEVGQLKFKVLYTPGHTPEHISFLVSGGKGASEPWGIFTGDTLFAGEVGRPDLIGGGTEKKLARQLYHTLHEKILKVGDQVELYPAHGEGSPCGGNIGDRDSSTVGYERLSSKKLQARSEEEFVKAVLEDLPPAPFYYSRMKKINAEGPRVLKCLPVVQPISAKEFAAEMKKKNRLVLDTREIEAFGGAHIEGSLNIALRTEFPIWSGWMLKPEVELLLVLPDEDYLDSAVRHLLRVGYDNIAGYLRKGMRGWMEAGMPFKKLPQMSIHELKEVVVDEKRNGLQVLDVRREDELKQGKIPKSQHIFAAFLPEQLDKLDRNRAVATYCGSGYRASIAASVLKRNGFKEVFNIPGSMKAWNNAGFPVEEVEEQQGG